MLLSPTGSYLLPEVVTGPKSIKEFPAMNMIYHPKKIHRTYAKYKESLTL
jgi:hypothetical protein